MQLNRWNCYSDFVVYPAVVLALSGLALRITPVADWWRCGLLFLAGAIAWTLAEYALHRFVSTGSLGSARCMRRITTTSAL